MRNVHKQTKKINCPLQELWGYWYERGIMGSFGKTDGYWADE